MSGTTYLIGSGLYEGSGPAPTTTAGLVLGDGDILGVDSGGVATATVIGDGGSAYVAAYGVIQGSLVQSGGVQTLGGGYLNNDGSLGEPGGTGSDSVVLSGGEEDVQQDGIATGTTISSGGVQSAYAGTKYVPQGITSGSIIQGGYEDVEGAAYATQVVAGGLVEVSYGGTSFGTQIGAGGTELVSAVGAASGTVVGAGGTQVLLSLGGLETVTSSGVVGTVSRTGNVLFYTTSNLIETFTSSGGLIVETFSSGGVTESHTISKGPTFDLFADGTATATTVQSGGTILLAGGATPGLAVQPGGEILIGGTYLDGADGSGGFYSAVMTGETITGLDVTDGALLVVSGSNVVQGATIENGGSETLSSGATDSAGMIDALGSSTVLAGGTASNDVVFGALLLAGGEASGTTLGSGGTLAASGATAVAFGTHILSAAQQTISAGATATSTVVSFGGTEIALGGSTTGTLVQAGGTESIGLGGIADQLGVLPYGAETVLSGGEDEGSLIVGRETVSSGGLTSGTQIAVSGNLVVYGGTILSGQVNGGGTELILSGIDSASKIQGTQIVSGGLVVSALIVTSGTQVVDGGVVISTGVGGTEIVSAGGLTSASLVGSSGLEVVYGVAMSTTVFNSGTLEVQAGGTTSNAVVTSATEILSAGAISLQDVLLDEGLQIVLSGAIASGTVLNDPTGFTLVGGVYVPITANGDPLQIVSSGGLAFSTYVSVGSQTVLSGGSAVSGRIADTETVLSGGYDSGTIVSGGTQILSGGTALDVTLLGQAKQTLFDGAVASVTYVNSGTTLNVAGGTSYAAIDRGTETVTGSGIAVSGTLLGLAAVDQANPGPGYLLVSGGGTVSATTISGGGLEQVLSGGTAIGTTVMVGGEMDLDSSGSVLGAVISSGGIVKVYGGTISGAIISAGGVLGLQSLALTGGAPITFSGSGASLVVGTAPEIGTVLSGFGPGDEVFFNSIAYDPADTVSVSANTVTVTTAGGTEYDLDLAGAATAPLELTKAAFAGLPGGYELVLMEPSDATPCFCAGTMILSDRGEIPIEQLTIGDWVVTFDGEPLAIRWIGRRSYAGRSLAGRAHVLPVRIEAGALGDGLPRRDLRVSPLHAMYLDGVLVPAGQLTNGSTIVQERECLRVDYLHLELERHEVIWAEGAPSETFLDDDSRGLFHNASEHAALYPGAASPGRSYAPRVEHGYQLEAIREKLCPPARPSCVAAGSIRERSRA